jgi:hypothetical protein
MFGGLAAALDMKVIAAEAAGVAHVPPAPPTPRPSGGLFARAQ